MISIVLYQPACIHRYETDHLKAMLLVTQFALTYLTKSEQLVRVTSATIEKIFVEALEKRVKSLSR